MTGARTPKGAAEAVRRLIVGIRTSDFAAVMQARTSIGRYLDGFYNSRRPHSSLGQRTPDQAYFNLPTPIPAAA